MVCRWSEGSWWFEAKAATSSQQANSGSRTYMGVCESVAFGGGKGGGWDRPRGRATCRALRIAKDHTCVYKYTHYHHPVACYALIHDLIFLSFHPDY